MAAPQSVIWTPDDHTRAKHLILRKYLDAWLPILAHNDRRVLLIDGFAGPGEYEGGEDGSPLIMLKALREHRQKELLRQEVHFLFIEKHRQRCEHLRHLLQRYQASNVLPPRVSYQVECGEFTALTGDLLNRLKQGREHYDAIFAFIDPFGFSNTPMWIISELMRNPRSEVLITFMYEEINRFLEVDYSTKTQQFDALFGTDEWQTIALDHPDSQTRLERLHDLYRRQLLTVAGARYVRSFSMRNRQNTTDYLLFFATRHRKGMENMKRAMWKVDKTGSFVFSDCTGLSQMFLLEKPDYTILQSLLRNHFRGRTVTVDTIEEFVIAETPFCCYKKEALAVLERTWQILVLPSGPRHPGVYNRPDMLIHFL
jgi:three-Cys-motif partner protein